MRRTATVMLALVGWCFLVAPAAALPNLLSVQGALRTGGGAPDDGEYEVAFRLYESELGGVALFEEVQTLPVHGGVFDALLGAVGTLDPAVFVTRDALWLELQLLAGTGVADSGDDPLPRVQLTTSAWAFRAGYADRAAVADLARGIDTACDACIPASALSPDIATDDELAAVEAKIPTQSLSTLALSCAAGQYPLLLPDGTWECGVAAPEPSINCKDQGKALNWDGADWECVTTETLSLSGGHANGFQATDEWGDAWDGMPRAGATWANAQAKCTKLGGRLPTITELYRNRHAAPGTGNVGTSQNDEGLWTLIPSHGANTWVTVRLSDGAVAQVDENVTAPYRCVWPVDLDPAFDGPDCHAHPGDGCFVYRDFFNIDRITRPGVNVVAAVQECRFYGAGLMDLQDAQHAIQRGLPAHDAASGPSWIHITSLLFLQYNDPSPGTVHTGSVQLRTDDDLDSFYYRSPNEVYSGQIQTGSLADVNTPYGFRCIGKRVGAPSYQAADPPCKAPSGQADGASGCFTRVESPAVAAGKNKVIADAWSRPKADWATASAHCDSLGGALPDGGKGYHLMQQRWENFTEPAAERHVWLNQPVHYNPDGSLRVAYLRPDVDMTDAAAARWAAHGVSGNARLFSTLPGNAVHYRCVWPETVEPPDDPVSCDVSDIKVWDADAGVFACEAAPAAEVVDVAPEALVTDGWGYRWDAEDRPPATWTDARQTCEDLGGRLPVMTELHRNSGDSPFPEATRLYEGAPSTTPLLWTSLPNATPDVRIAVPLGDGNYVGKSMTSEQAFRCVWPPSGVDEAAYAAHRCHAAPGEGCFQAGSLAMDPISRFSANQVTASKECALLGGVIPTLAEMVSMLNAGIPRTWLPGVGGPRVWLMEPGVTNARYGYIPLNLDTATVPAMPNYGLHTGGDNRMGFRCLFGSGPVVGKVARWDLDEAPGGVTPSTGGRCGPNCGATLAQGATMTDGDGLFLNGFGQYAQVADKHHILDHVWAVSIAARIRRHADQNNGEYTIVSNTASGANVNQRSVQLVVDGHKLKLRIYGEGDATSEVTEVSGPLIPNDQWHHVAATWNFHGEARLYLDGELVKQQPSTTAGPTFDSDVPLLIGTRASGLTNGQPEAEAYWHGHIDDLVIYDRQLSNDEVAALAAQAGQ